jgi:hypothetical protein
VTERFAVTSPDFSVAANDAFGPPFHVLRNTRELGPRRMPFSGRRAQAVDLECERDSPSRQRRPSFALVSYR